MKEIAYDPRQHTLRCNSHIINLAGYFAIYTNGSGIEGKVGASAATVFASIPGEAAITLDREQDFLGPLT